MPFDPRICVATLPNGRQCGRMIDDPIHDTPLSEGGHAFKRVVTGPLSRPRPKRRWLKLLWVIIPVALILLGTALRLWLS